MSHAPDGPKTTLIGWQPIKTAPRDGRRLLMTDGENIHICYPKQFPRAVSPGDDMTTSRPGDVWEYFRDDERAPGHSWSMCPTHWMPLPEQPTPIPIDYSQVKIGPTGLVPDGRCGYRIGGSFNGTD